MKQYLDEVDLLIASDTGLEELIDDLDTVVPGKVIRVGLRTSKGITSCQDAKMSAPSNGETSNVEDIVFPEYKDDWGAVLAVYVINDMGHMIAEYSFPEPITVENGDSLTFKVGNFCIGLE